MNWHFCSPNDGLVEVGWSKDKNLTHGDLQEKYQRVREGYADAYMNRNRVIRGKKIKVIYKGKDGNPNEYGPGQAPLTLDGEMWNMDKFYTVECIPDAVEYFFNPASYFREYPCFTD